MERCVLVILFVAAVNSPAFSDTINPRSPFYQALSCVLLAETIKRQYENMMSTPQRIPPQFKDMFGNIGSSLANMQRNAMVRAQQVHSNETDGDVIRYKSDFESEYQYMLTRSDYMRMSTILKRCIADFGPSGQYSDSGGMGRAPTSPW